MTSKMTSYFKTVKEDLITFAFVTLPVPEPEHVPEKGTAVHVISGQK